MAVADLTETLSLELEGTNIQVNALSPGSIHTRMWEETRDAAAVIGDTELYEYGVRVTSGGGPRWNGRLHWPCSWPATHRGP